MTNGNGVWEHVFDTLPVLQEVQKAGQFFISSAQLNSISKPLGGPDARNLVKYDHRVLLPPVFKQHGLSLLPIARGEFLIGPFKIYAPLPDNEVIPVRPLAVPEHLESLKSLSSETDALMAAYYGKAIDQVLGEEVLYTTAGKAGGPAFEMLVDTQGKPGLARRIQVRKGVSIEIDAIYEGPTVVAAFEAKMKSVVDFNVRQLYYPYRYLLERHKKDVRTVFLTYSNEIFDVRVFRFDDELNISSFSELSRWRFTRSQDVISINDLLRLAEAVPKAREIQNQFPFPQADSLERVINLVEMVLRSLATKREIADAFGFHERQSDYYANAAGYLGLVNRIAPGIWGPTKLAREIFSLNYRERNLSIAELVLAGRPFKETFLEAKRLGNLPGSDFVLTSLRASSPDLILSGSTPGRRVGTILGWVRWLLALAA